MQPKPYKKRPDWYVITEEQLDKVRFCPGVQGDTKTGEWICHRNVLPLLGVRLPARTHDLDNVFGDGETQLRPHQIESANFIRNRRGTLLADSMRLGKTAGVIAAHDPDSGPLVVIGPLAVRHVWRDWFKRRWPDVEPSFLAGRTYSRDNFENAKIVFAHYNIADKWTSMGIARRIGTLVYDEAHELSNWKTKRAKGAHTMAPAAERIVLATGTPLYNRPDGIWSLLNIVAPAGWGRYWDFTARYADGKPGAHGWTTGEPTNVDEFVERLQETMLRRTWQEIFENVPETQRDVQMVSIDASSMQRLDMLVQAITYADGDGDGESVVKLLGNYRSTLGKFKAEPAAELTLEAARSGPVVVWVWHTAVADTIEEIVSPHFATWKINGKTKIEKREDMLDAWRQDAHGVLVMSLGVGQQGIDLSHSSRAIFAELDWTPAIIGQGEMRTFDPKRPNEVTFVVANHETDQRLAEVLTEKCDRALQLGLPAADTPLDVIGEVLGTRQSKVADLGGLLDMVRQKALRESATFE